MSLPAARSVGGDRDRFSCGNDVLTKALLARSGSWVTDSQYWQLGVVLNKKTFEVLLKQDMKTEGQQKFCTH